MYNLGDKFINNNKRCWLSKPGSVFKGNNYRISLLTERLVRLEYDDGGIFNNYETATVKNRMFDVPEFNKQEDENYIFLETRYFVLKYRKNSLFRGNNLICNGKNGKIWSFDDREIKNLRSCGISLDNVNNFNISDLEKGLFSFDGYATIDDSAGPFFDEYSNVVIPEFSKNHVDVYLFMYGKDFGLCLNDFFKLTCNPPLIPRYALGNWWSRDIGYNENEVYELIEKFRRNNIPLSIFLLDNEWNRGSSNYPEIKVGYTFNSDLFPNTRDFINRLHINDIKLGVKINPKYGFIPTEKYYDTTLGYKKSMENGIIPFNPNSMQDIDIFLKLYINPLKNEGVDLIWNDYDEYDKKNLYLLNYYLLKNNTDSENRNLVLSRNSTYDAHMFNVLYSGHLPMDWQTLSILPFYNLNSANMGISFWSHDISGSLDGIEDGELYTRSLQFGVFSPILRFNAIRGNYFKKEPWKWDVLTNNVCGNYLRLRHKLIPYIYSEAYRYHKNGTPLIKPFYYNNLTFYDDPNYVNQYYFGSEFMISPIIKPMDKVINRTIQRFYMPSGVWYDFTTGKRFMGDNKYLSFYPIEDYPIFVKRGSIIPMAANESLMSYKNPKTLEIHVFPGESNTYHLYEDDGESNRYIKGEYCITELDYNYRASNYTLIIRTIEGVTSVLPEKRNYRIVFRNTKKSDKLVVYENDKIYGNVETDATETDFIINIYDISTSSQVVVNCYGQNIEIDNLKVINDDIKGILMDMKISTLLKDKVDEIMFNDSLPFNKKRIAIRKLKKKGLDPRSVKIFLKLLEYMEMQVD